MPGELLGQAGTDFLYLPRTGGKCPGNLESYMLSGLTSKCKVKIKNQWKVASRRWLVNSFPHEATADERWITITFHFPFSTFHYSFLPSEHVPNA